MIRAAVVGRKVGRTRASSGKCVRNEPLDPLLIADRFAFTSEQRSESSRESVNVFPDFTLRGRGGNQRLRPLELI